VSGQHNVSKWTETTTANNSAATATRTAESGKSHYVTSVHGSFSAANIKLMTLKDGATIIGNFHVHNQRDVIFDKPVRITQGNAAVVELAASGTGGEIGAVTMCGYTVE